MLTRVIKPFLRRGEIVTAGTVLEIPADVLPKLAGYVEALPRHRADLPQSEPRAWLEGGELRTSGVFDDLATEIARLTAGDLDQQKRLLTEHCQAFGPSHFWALVEAWQERAAIMEHEAGMTKAEAEHMAAEAYCLLPWLPELLGATLH